jgi:hypothetical protein
MVRMIFEEARQQVEPLDAGCVQARRASGEQGIVEREQQSTIDDFGLQPNDLPLQLQRIASCVDVDVAHFLELSLLLVGFGLHQCARVHRDSFMRSRWDGCTHSEQQDAGELFHTREVCDRPSCESVR